MNLPDLHFLTSQAWQDYQASLKNAVWRLKTPLYEVLAVKEQKSGYARLYCPYGPWIASEGNFAAANQALFELAEREGADWVRIEPTGQVAIEDLKKAGYRRVKAYQPSLTWVLDLAPSEEELLAAMKQANRNLYRNGHKKGLVFEEGKPDDVEDLIRLTDAVAEHNRANLRTGDYLRQQIASLASSGAGKIWQVKLDGQVIASAMTYDSPTTRYYAFAAADYQQRKLAAGAYLLAKIIIDAKRSGQQFFDFYGITDSDDSSHPWHGFSQFKKGFGGRYLPYLGTWEKPLKPAKYWLYRVVLAAMRRINHTQLLKLGN